MLAKGGGGGGGGCVNVFIAASAQLTAATVSMVIDYRTRDFVRVYFCHVLCEDVC